MFTFVIEMSNARTYGTIHSEQKPFVIQHANSTDYLLGGSLVMTNGKLVDTVYEEITDKSIAEQIEDSLK